MRRILIVITGLTLVATVACNQVSTTLESTTSVPQVTKAAPTTTTDPVTTTTEPELVWPPRMISPSLVYDESAELLVLFGGATEIHPMGVLAQSNDTWVFDLGRRSWVRLKPSMRPLSRSQAALAYDTQSELVVMIGGDFPTPAPILNTWVYQSSTQDWRIVGRGPISKEREQELDLAGGIHRTSIAYDVESDRTVLFGGGWSVPWGDALYAGSEHLRLLDETWVYDADTNTWEDLQPDPHPAGRYHHGMVNAPDSDRVLLWGGDEGGPNVWAYDYNTNSWTEHINEGGPQPTGFDGPLAFDTESDRMVVIREGAEVWDYHFDTNTWTQHPTQLEAPISTAFSGITYVGGDIDRTALYGGCLEHVAMWQELFRTFPEDCSNELWFYDLNTNTWEKIGPPDG